MPTYEIDAPDGKTYQIDGPPGATREQIIAAIIRQEPGAAIPANAPNQAPTPPPAKGEKSLADSLLQSVDRVQGVGYGAAEWLGEITGAQGLANWGGRGRVSNDAEAAQYGESTTLGDIQNAGDAGQWLKETVGEVVPQIAPGVVGGIGGFLVGGPIGALVGAFAPSLVLGVGEVHSGAKEKDPNYQGNLTTLAGGSAIAVLDTILPGKIGGQIARKFGRETAEEIAQRALAKPVSASLLSRVAREGGKGALVEGVTEAVQEAIGEVSSAAAVGQSPDWANLPNMMLEAGAKGAVGGGLFGGVTGALPQPQVGGGQDEAAAVDVDAGLNLSPEQVAGENAVRARAAVYERDGFDPDDAISIARNELGIPDPAAQEAVPKRAAKRKAPVDGGVGAGVPSADGGAGDTGTTEPAGGPELSGLEPTGAYPSDPAGSAGAVQPPVAAPIAPEAALTPPVIPGATVKERLANAKGLLFGVVSDPANPMGEAIRAAPPAVQKKLINQAAQKLAKKGNTATPEAALNEVMDALKIERAAVQEEVAPVEEQQPEVAPEQPAPTFAAPQPDITPVNEAIDDAFAAKEEPQPTENIVAAQEVPAPTQIGEETQTQAETVVPQAAPSAPSEAQVTPQPAQEEQLAAFVAPEAAPAAVPASAVAPKRRFSSAASKGVYSETEFRAATGKQRNKAFAYYKQLTKAGRPTHAALKETLQAYAPDSALLTEMQAAEEQEAAQQAKRDEATKLKVDKPELRAPRQISDRINIPEGVPDTVSKKLKTAAEDIALAAKGVREPDDVTVGISLDPTKPNKPYSLTIKGAKLVSNEEGGRVDVRASTPEGVVAKVARLKFKSQNGKWIAELAQVEREAEDNPALRRIQELERDITRALVEGSINQAEGNRLRKELEGDITDAAVDELRADFEQTTAKSLEQLKVLDKSERALRATASALATATSELASVQRKKRGGLAAARRAYDEAYEAHQAALKTWRDIATTVPKIDRPMTDLLDGAVPSSEALSRVGIGRTPAPTGLTAILEESTKEGIPVTNALAWVAENSRNPALRKMARKLIPLTRGVMLRSAQVYPNGNRWRAEYAGTDNPPRLPNGITEGRAHGLFSTNSRGEDEVWLSKPPEGVDPDDLSIPNGWNEVTLLHEVIHAAMLRYYGFFQLRGRGYSREQLEADGFDREAFQHTERAENAVQDLVDSWITAVGYWEAHRDSPQWEHLSGQHREVIEFALSNPDEFIAFGVTEPVVRTFLETIPSDVPDAPSLWRRITNAIRNLLGLNTVVRSAFNDVMDYASILTEEVTGLAPPLAGRSNRFPDNRSSTTASRDVERVKKKFAASRRKEDIPHPSDSPVKNLKNRLLATTMAIRKAWLHTLTRFSFETGWGARFPQIKQAIAFIEKKMGMQERLSSAAVGLIDRIVSYGRGYVVLAEALYANRMLQVDPTQFTSVDDAKQNDPVVKAYAAAIKKKKNLETGKALDDKTKRAYERKIARRQESVTHAYERWDNLDAEGKALVKEIRDYWRRKYHATRKLLDDIINEMDISAQQKKSLLSYARQKFEEAKTTKHEYYSEIDPALLPVEYFPLRRFGGKYLIVKRKNRAEREFHMDKGLYPLLTAAQRAMVDLGNDAVFVMGTDAETDINSKFNTADAVIQEALTRIDKVLDDPKNASGRSTNTDLRNELRDSIYQLHLMTLSERQGRRNFLHSEEVAGFDLNVPRIMQENAELSARQLAKMKYDRKIKLLIEEAEATLEVRPGEEQTFDEMVENMKLRDMLNVLKNNHIQNAISPLPTSPWVSKLLMGTHFMLLSGPVTAAVNIVSLAFGYASVAARLGGTNAMNAIIPYMRIWKTLGIRDKHDELGMPEVAKSAYVKENAARQWFFAEAERRLLFDGMNDTIQRLKTESELANNGFTNRGALRRVSSKVGTAIYDIAMFAFKFTEVNTRQIIAGTAFDAAYNSEELKGLSESARREAAMDKAVFIMKNSVGDYGMTAMPAFMQQYGAAKLVWVLKQFVVNITRMIIHDSRIMLGAFFPRKKEDGKWTWKQREDADTTPLEAAKELSGVLATVFMFAGAMGMPFSNVIFTMLDLMDWVEDDDEDAKERLAQDPLGAFDSEYYFKEVFMPNLVGDATVNLFGKEHPVSEVIINGPLTEGLNLNIGPRVGLGDMFMREPMAPKGTTEAIKTDPLGYAADFLLANVPPASVASNFIRGSAEIAGGEPKGWEKVSPAIARGPLKAARRAREGEIAPDGTVIIGPIQYNDKTGTLGIAAQALGLDKADIAQFMDWRWRQKSLREKIERDRSALQKKFNTVLGDARGVDPKKYQKAVDDIIKWNTMYANWPEYWITEQGLAQSFRTWGSSRTKDNFGGVELDKYNRQRMIDATAEHRPQ